MRFPIIASCIVLAFAGGCTAIADVGRFQAEPSLSGADGGGGGSTSSSGGPVLTDKPYVTVRFNALNMTPHNRDLFELRLIDQNNSIQARAVLDPPGTSDFTVTLPNALPKENFQAKNWHFDYFGDVNKSGGYDGIGKVATNDHAWRIDPLADYPTAVNEPGVVNLKFLHNTNFTEINDYPSGTPNPSKSIGLDIKISFKNMDNYVGRLLQARISDFTSGRTVGLYRIGHSPADGVQGILQPAFVGTVPGVVDVSTKYRVEVYVDANGDDTYQNPKDQLGDVGWVVSETSNDATGLVFDFDPTAQPQGSSNADIGPL